MEIVALYYYFNNLNNRSKSQRLMRKQFDPNPSQHQFQASDEDEILHVSNPPQPQDNHKDPDDSFKSSEVFPSHPKPASFCIKLLLGVFVVISVLKLVLELSKNKDELKAKILSMDFIYIETGYGNFVSLPYENPTVVFPRHAHEPEVEKETLQLDENMTTTVSDFEFSLNLLKNWQTQEQTLFNLEYFLLNKTYNIDSFVSEKGMCIISPYNNMMSYGSGGSELLFFKSLDEQNYSNYRVVLIDDGSVDQSTEYVMEKLSLYPRLSNRVQILKNKERIGSLASTDIAIRTYCEPGQIVLKVDIEDALIGKQALNLLNRFYKNSSVWFAYTNYAFLSDKVSSYARSSVASSADVHSGLNEDIDPEVLKLNRYRADGVWVTYSFYSFLRDLYVKIPPSHLIERGSAKYFSAAPNLFIGYALIELAGANHTFFYPQFLYFDFIDEEVLDSGCSRAARRKYQAMARALVPLLPLTALQDKVAVTKQYKRGAEISANFVDKQREYLMCSERAGKMDRIFDESL